MEPWGASYHDFLALATGSPLEDAPLQPGSSSRSVRQDQCVLFLVVDGFACLFVETGFHFVGPSGLDHFGLEPERSSFLLSAETKGVCHRAWPNNALVNNCLCGPGEVAVVKSTHYCVCQRTEFDSQPLLCVAHNCL